MTPDTPPPRAAYDRIAEHFAETRGHPWPEVERFVTERVPADASRALDVGCGNGRHAELLAERAARVVGIDASLALLRTASERASENGFADAFVPVGADAARLPLRAECADAALYVATLHHLRPRARRRGSLDDLARVLRPGAPALVSAWSVVHDRFDADEGFDTTVDWTLPGGETVPRYYHVYDLAEFRADLDGSDLDVVTAFVSSGNCYAVVRGIETVTDPEPGPGP